MGCIKTKQFSSSRSYDELKAEITDFIKENLKEKRIKHTYSVVSEARKLAEKYGEDPDKAELAALFHDMFRSMSSAVLNMYIRQLGLQKKYIDNPNLSHAKIAAEVMKSKYDIIDEDLINAVAYHTTGRENMSLLEKIIFLADAIEPDRNYPTVEDTRSLAYENIDKACLNSLERTIEYIQGTGNYLDPDTINARDYLKENMNL
jgi:predicted HD superfamily hydrolase involved in NAD metabolism